MFTMLFTQSQDTCVLRIHVLLGPLRWVFFQMQIRVLEA